MAGFCAEVDWHEVYWSSSLVSCIDSRNCMATSRGTKLGYKVNPHLESCDIHKYDFLDGLSV